MKQGSLTRFLRSLTALVLALMLPFNALAATLVMPKALTVVEAQAFMNNTSIEDIVLPEGIKIIGAQAFAGCTALKKAVIPATVENIAADAFEGLQGQMTIETVKDSYAWNWGVEHGFIVVDPSMTFDVMLGQTTSTLYLEGNLETARVAELTAQYDLAEDEAIEWKIEKVSGDDGVALTVESDETQPAWAVVMASEVTAAGTSMWRVSAAAPNGESWQQMLTIRVANTPENYPTRFIGPDSVEGKVGERIEVNFDELLALDAELPEDGNTPVISIGLRDLWGNETYESLDNGFAFTPDHAGEYWVNLRLNCGNWQFAKEFCFIITSDLDVNFWHYSPTLFLGGNQPEMDVAEMKLIGELAEGESVEWNVEKVSGSDGANLYIGSVSEDGLRAYVFTGEVTAEGESVWRASAKFPDGSTWEKEFTTTVIPMPADMPTELDVDYPMYAELNKRFEFKPSERIHNLDEFPDVGNTIISHVAYYAEIWEDPTHEHIDDGYNGAFAFTPTKSERYGFTLYTYIGNHCVEHLGILVVGDGTSDRETIVEDLPEVIYLHGEGGSNWLGNVIVERYHLLPGEEVQWSIELIDSSNAVPAAEVYIGDLFENTRGANLYLGEVSGEPGTVTYLITAEVGGSVFTFEYVLAVNQEPENLPEGITVPQTYYEVEVGDSLTFLTDDIQLVNGEVPEGAQLRKEYWHIDMLEEQQELTWTEDGFTVRFVQEGRYQISAAALIGNILYELPIQIVVGSGVSADARMDTRQSVSTLYTGLEGNTHVFNADIQGYELFEGESYQWTLEQIGGDKLFDVYIDNEYDEWRGVNIHAEGCTDQTGSMTFRLTAASEGGLNLSTEFTIDVAELPEDLPTEIIIPSDLYELNVGDTLTLLFEDIRFGDGVIPDGNEVIRQYWGIEELPGYEWLEDGESATFDTEGRYAVDAVIGVGNYRLIKRIGIVVGSGLENAELACEQILYTVYAEQEEHKHAFTAEVLGYDLFEGESYEWNLEVIDGSEEMLESYFGGEFDNWRGVAVMIGDYHGTGSVTYRLTVTSEGGLNLSTDFTINVVELPEGLPTELVMDPSVFELNVGDSLTLSMEMFDFGEGVIPEDATIRTSFRDDWQLPNLNWLDEKSFTATFDANGRYQIWAVKEINNYTLLKPIMIIVGSGTPENVTFLYEQKVSKVYLEAGLEEHTAYFGVFDYPLLDGETYEWKLDLAEGDDLLGFRDYENEEGDHNDLYLCGATGETGSSVYRMTVTTNKGLSHEWLLPFEVEHLPENMPTALNVPEGGYRFNVGDVYDFDSNVLEVTDGVVPEDVAVRKEYWGIDQIPNGYWVEKENPQPGYFNEPTVYHVEFDREGRYSFNAAYRIGNYNVIAPVNVIVGDGFETEPEIKEEYFGSVQYANVNGGSWVGDVYLDNYPVLNGEELKWTMERIDDNECNPGEVIIDHQSDDGTWIGMHIHEFTGETGATTWKLTVESSTGFTLSKEYQIEFVEMPANLPTEIAVPEEIVYLNVGDTYVAKESDIGFANGVVPEGVDVAIQFGGYLGENNEVNWTEDGFEATFHQEGRYVYQVFAVINGYELCKDVFVIVGDYKPEGQIAEEAFFATQYVNMDGTNWVASLYLDGYEMLGGEWMDWKIERIDENAANPVRTIDYSADGTWVGVHVCDFTGETGTVTWRVTAQSSLGYSWSKEYDITFVKKPENLPTEITVPEEVVYLDVNETYVVSRNDIGFANGVVPEGVEPYVDLMAGHLQECGDFEWTEDGFAVTFHQDGRYVYSVSITINGFEMFKDVSLVVGSGVPADAWVEYWGTERTVYTNSEYQVWAFDAYVHNYERLPDEEFIWTLEQVSEGEPAVEVQRDEGDNWLGVWYNLLPTGEATGTVVYKLTLETSSGFTSSQEFTLHVVDRPDTLPTGIVVDQTEFQLAVDEVFTFTNEQVHLADGEVSDSDWTSIHFDRLWEGIEEQETFRWLEGDVHGFEVSFPQDGRYGFEVHYWINNILYVQPITITVGTGIPADARLVADVVMDTVFYGDGAAHDVYVGNVGVDGYRLLSGEEYEWTYEVIDAPEDHMPIELVLADEYDDGNGINMHATGINNGTGAVTWRVHFTTEGGLDLTTDITINVVDLPENVQAEIALPATEYQFEVGDEFELFNDEIQIVKCEGLEDYAFLKEYWLADHIPGCEGRETGIYFHFEEEGRYLVYAAVRWGNYFVEQPVTITVGDGIPGDATFVYHQKYTKFYSNIDNAVNHMAWFEINDYQLAEDEHFDWWLEHVSGSDLVDMHWDIVRDDGSEAWLYVDGFRGEQGVGTYRLNVATNHGLRYFVEFDVEVVDCPEGLPTEMFAPKTEFHFEIGDTYEFRNDVLELGEGYIPEGAKIIKEYWGFEGLPGAELIHETGDIEGDGWRVTFNENGRYQIHASIKIESYTLAVPCTITVGTGVSDDAGLELAVGKEVTLYNVPEAVWVNDACLNNYTLLEGETVEWSLERVDTNGTDLGEVYVDFTFNDGLDAALRMRNITGETGTMIWNLTGKTSGGFAWSTDLVVNVVDGANRPTDATIANEEVHLEVGETYSVRLEDIGFNAGVEGMTTFFEIYEDGLEGYHTFQWVDGGFDITFEENGRHQHHYSAIVGGIEFYKPVSIIVGSGYSDDTFVEWIQDLEIIYTDLPEFSTWIGCAYLYNYNVLSDEDVSWTLERVDGDETTPVELYITHETGDITVPHLRYTNIQGSGTVTYRLTVNTQSGFTDSHDYTVTVENLPENLPTDIDVQTYYEIGVGETFVFNANEASFADGVVPENASTRYHVNGGDFERFTEMESFQWLDNGFQVTFDQEGRYMFGFGMQIGNYTLRKDIYIVVGNGVPADATVALLNGPNAVMYNVAETSWIIEAYLYNYRVLPDERVEWTLERVDENEGVPAELYIDSTWDDGCSMRVCACNVTGETGEMVWRLTLNTSHGFTWSQDINVTVLDGTNRPTDIAVPAEDVYLNVGDTYTASMDDLHFADGNVDGLPIYMSFGMEGLDGYHDFRWVDDGWGFEVTFHESGRYHYYAIMWVGGVEYVKEIRLHVGTGESETAWLNVWHSQNPVYVGGADTWNGNAYVQDFPLFEGESIEWTLEQKNADEVPAAELYIAENEYWDETLGMNYHVKDAAAVGETTYVVTAKLPSGQVLQEELTLYVQEMPENLPTELCVPQESYTLAVGERVTLRPYDIGFGEGDIPEDAAHHADIWPNGPYQAEWYDDNGETVDIWFEEPGVYNICFVRWIGNYVLYKDVPVTVVDASSENVIEVWVAENVRDFTTAQIASFQAENADYADIAFIVNSVGESDAADAVLADAENSGDLFVFAQDQLARLVSAGRLEPVSADNMATIAAENDEGSVKAVQIGETAYAYPMTSDNGYFLYYDSSVVQDPSTLENVIAYCEDSGRTVCFEITSGWYQPAFFFGAGCTLTYGYDSEGNINSCDVNYASENGVRALKAMIGLARSENFANISIAGDTQNMGALVSGTWDASTVQQLLGDNYAAVKLPTVDGFQMSGFGGFKMLGIKPQTDEHKLAACEALAMYLTSEAVQTERYEAVQWGPSNLKAQQNEAVQNNVALSALADQLQYCVPQGQYPDEYWNIAEQFGRRVLAGEFDDMTDADLLEVLTTFQQEAMALAQ